WQPPSALRANPDFLIWIMAGRRGLGVRPAIARGSPSQPRSLTTPRVACPHRGDPQPLEHRHQSEMTAQTLRKGVGRRTAALLALGRLRAEAARRKPSIAEQLPRGNWPIGIKP